MYTPLRARGGGLGDMGENLNPDGTPTYDGNVYDPTDPFNPYNAGQPNYTPTTIQLSTTSIGTVATPTLPPLVNYMSPPVPVTGFTALPLNVQAQTPPTTSVVQDLSSLFSSVFGTKTATPVTAVKPLVAGVAAPSSGMSMTTILLLAAGAGAILLASKKRS